MRTISLFRTLDLLELSWLQTPALRLSQFYVGLVQVGVTRLLQKWGCADKVQWTGPKSIFDGVQWTGLPLLQAPHFISASRSDSTTSKMGLRKKLFLRQYLEDLPPCG